MLHLWDTINSLPWGAWVAIVALLVGLGAFLDEYYVQEPARERARKVLIALLLRLENSRQQIKDMSRYLLEIGSNALGGGIMLLTGYLLQSIPSIHKIISPFTDLISSIGIICMVGSLLLTPFVVAPLTYYLLKGLLSVTFKPACEPKRSPFKFVTSMMGIWILGAKLILEFIK